MPNLTIFQSQMGSVRTVGTFDDPLFCMVDVCKILGVDEGNARRKLRNLRGCQYDRPLSQSIQIDTAGGKQTLVFLNEEGLYNIIFSSRKKEAIEFRHWVLGEVLPTIRKEGQYVINQQKNLIEQQKETIEKQQKLIDYNASVVEYTRNILNSKKTYTFTQISKDLGFKSVYAFTKWLIDNEIVYKQSEQYLPTSKYSNGEYFKTRTYSYVHSDGTPDSSMSTVITEKGRNFFHNFINKNEAVE